MRTAAKKNPVENLEALEAELHMLFLACDRIKARSPKPVKEILEEALDAIDEARDYCGGDSEEEEDDDDAAEDG